MREHRAEMYREFTGWAAWVYILLYGAIGLSTLPLLMGIDDAAAWSTLERLLWSGLLFSSAGVIHLLFGGLLVTVERDGVRVGLGKARLLKTFLPFQDIVSMEPVTYSPIKEFGGWGLRGMGKKKAWTARGNQALVFTLTDERRIYVGSDQPSKLESRVRHAMASGGWTTHSTRDDDWE